MSETKEVINVVISGDDGATVHIREVMAEYQCFKVVQAAEIKDVKSMDEQQNLSLIIGIPGTDIDLPYIASQALIARYTPVAGDYIALYENDYVSISPKKVFEEGYNKIEFADVGGDNELGIPQEHMGQVNAIAKMCHEVNRAYTAAIREPLKHWHELEEQDKNIVIEHVAFLIINVDADVKAWHDAWVSKMIVAGWKYDAKRSLKNKTHEHLKPFHHLPEKQQVKDALFHSVVKQAIHAG